MLTLNQPRRHNRLPLVMLAIILLVAGLYLLAVSLAPQLPLNLVGKDAGAIPKQLATSQPGDNGNRVYIPKIGVEISYQDGDESALETGAWWRSPDSGNPRDGGNFVLAAHRFQMGLTPQNTVRQSPLYHIDKLEVEDQIIVDYEDKRYVYEISKIHQVAPSATEIEAPTDEAQLTLYSCTLGGSTDGREVIVAKLVGEA